MLILFISLVNNICLFFKELKSINLLGYTQHKIETINWNAPNSLITTVRQLIFDKFSVNLFKKIIKVFSKVHFSVNQMQRLQKGLLVSL